MTTHTCIHASAGTGKTTYLIKACSDYVEKGARVLLVSFTKAAAQEIKDRVDDSSGNVKATTLHSLVYGLCNIQRGSVVDQKKKKQFGDLIGMPVSDSYDPNGDSDKEITEADEAMSIISRADANMVPHMEEYDKSTRPLAVETFRFISNSYIKWKETLMYIDFNDMLKAYIDNPTDIDYDILCIDEAQDNSKLQWQVIHELQKQVQHVIVVGDLEQNLFTFGGADQHGMHTFSKRYKAKEFALPQSYRIPRSVHKVAERLRERMTIRSHTEYKPRDGEGRVIYANSLHEIKYDSRDTFVLYRTHSLRRDIEEDLIDKGVRYTVLTGYPSVWEGSMGQAVQGYIKFQKGEKLNKKEERALERWAVNTSQKSIPWHRVMIFPSHIMQYLIDTEHKTSTVRLSTIHGAKGKEADRVILFTGMTTRTLEGYELDPDVEHRVFYVGVTRTKTELCIVSGEDDYKI